MSQKNQFGKRLTPAAKRELIKLTDELRDVVILEAYKSAVERDPLSNEINVEDIIKSKVSVLGLNQVRKKTKSDDFILVYQWLGMFIGLFGLAYYLYETYEIDFSPGQSIALSLVISGVLLLGLMRLFKTLKSNYALEETPVRYSGEFLAEWEQIEQVLRTAGEKPGSARVPFSAILKQFVMDKKISTGERALFKELLSARNAILHGDFPLSKSELSRLTSEAKSFRKILEANVVSKASK